MTLVLTLCKFLHKNHVSPNDAYVIQLLISFTTQHYVFLIVETFFFNSKKIEKHSQHNFHYLTAPDANEIPKASALLPLNAPCAHT